MNDARESGNPAPKPKPADALANVREQFGAYFDAIPDIDAFVREQRGAPDGYDCRTRAERTDAELAALRQLVAQQADALGYLTNRVTALEATAAAHRTALEHTADTVQVLVLRGAP